MKTIYTNETQDLQTGEVITRQFITRNVKNTEMFVRAYIEDIGSLAKCSGAEQSVVLCCTKYLDYDTNQLVLTPDRRQEICECGNLTINTVNSAISRLYKKNILQRVEGKIFLNPKLFFFGKDIEREKMFKLEINYSITG